MGYSCWANSSLFAFIVSHLFLCPVIVFFLFSLYLFNSIFSSPCYCYFSCEFVPWKFSASQWRERAESERQAGESMRMSVILFALGFANGLVLKIVSPSALHYVTFFFDISTWTLTAVLWNATICQIFLLRFGLFILLTIQLQWDSARLFHIQQFLWWKTKMIENQR